MDVLGAGKGLSGALFHVAECFESFVVSGSPLPETGLGSEGGWRFGTRVTRNIKSLFGVRLFVVSGSPLPETGLGLEGRLAFRDKGVPKHQKYDYKNTHHKILQ